MSSWCVCGVLVLMLLSLTSIQDKIVKVTKLIDCDDEASEAFLQNLVRKGSVIFRNCILT